MEQWIPGDPAAPRVYLEPITDTVYVDRSPLPEIYHRAELSTAEVLEWLRRPSGDLRSDEAAYERVGEVLASNAAPPAFQAALFRALSSISGVAVVNDGGTFGGVDAVIIGRGDANETQFAFDAGSGRFLGMQGTGDPEVGTPLSYLTVYSSSLTTTLPARAQEQPS